MLDSYYLHRPLISWEGRSMIMDIRSGGNPDEKGVRDVGKFIPETPTRTIREWFLFIQDERYLFAERIHLRSVF